MVSIQHIYFDDHQSFDDFEFESSDYFVLTVNLLLGNEQEVIFFTSMSPMTTILALTISLLKITKFTFERKQYL